MIYKKYLIFLLSIILLIFCEFKSEGIKTIKHSMDYTDSIMLLDFQDSLTLLDMWKIDYGFNKDITLYGDHTYQVFKNNVSRTPGQADGLVVKSENAYISILFTDYYHEIESLRYFSLNSEKMGGKPAHVKQIYSTQNYSFKIGDTLSFCLKKLKDLPYEIKNDLISKNITDVEIHGLVSTAGKTTPPFDEYQCTYYFMKHKLYAIQIYYYRDKRY